MKRMSAFVRESAAGQALLATLLFCFIFVVLFAGLYKAGLSYIQKEKAFRGTDMTALSVGAVYANGLQLVRYSNVALMASVIADVITIVATEDAFDPNLRGAIHTLQKWIFGINEKGDGPGIGAYPFLFWLEGIQMAENNQLMDNWPSFSRGFSFPLPPLPTFLFNAETSDLKWLLIPNMALKFRSAADVFTEIPSEKIYYYYVDNSSGQTIFHPIDEVTPAKNSKNQWQMWVKPGLPDQYRYCRMKPVVTPGTNPANKDSFMGKGLQTASDLLKNIQFDVTHADDPQNHTVLVYDQLSSNISKGIGKGTLNFHSLSEAKLVGGGLAAWDIALPKFKVRLVTFEPQNLPVLRDWMSMLPNIPSMPAVPNIGAILQQTLPGQASSSSPVSGNSNSNSPRSSDSSSSPSFPDIAGLGLPQAPSIPQVPGMPDPTQGLEMPDPQDIGNMFGISVPSLPQMPGGI